MGSRRVRLRLQAALAAIPCALTLVSRAVALPCAGLPGPVYGVGSAAEKPLFAEIGKRLAAAPSAGTLIFQSPGTCAAVSLFASSGLMTGAASYWDQSGMERSCDLPLSGQAPSFASGAHALSACSPATSLPLDVKELFGPVQPIVFIVPKASSQASISAAAAYFVLGFGAAGQAEPWTDPSQVLVSSVTAPPAILLSQAIGVPTGKLHVTTPTGAAGVVTLTATSPDPNRALGLVGAPVADANRDAVRALAYQHFEQRCGYWPDSTPEAYDKRNVRDGHYALWAPVRFYARADAQGMIADPSVASILHAFTDGPAPAALDPIAASAAAGLVPRCAMTVWRDEELGALSSYAPIDPCGCAFEAAAGASSCAACASDAACPAGAPRCRHGFCEAY